MCPQEQPEPEQADKSTEISSTETSPDSSSTGGQVTVGSFFPPWPTWDSLNPLACEDHKAMCDKVERLQQVCCEGPLLHLMLSNEQTSKSKPQIKK